MVHRLTEDEWWRGREGDAWALLAPRAQPRLAAPPRERQLLLEPKQPQAPSRRWLGPQAQLVELRAQVLSGDHKLVARLASPMDR